MYVVCALTLYGTYCITYFMVIEHSMEQKSFTVEIAGKTILDKLLDFSHKVLVAFATYIIGSILFYKSSDRQDEHFNPNGSYTIPTP